MGGGACCLGGGWGGVSPTKDLAHPNILRKMFFKFVRYLFGMLVYQTVTKIFYFCKMTSF